MPPISSYYYIYLHEIHTMVFTTQGYAKWIIATLFWQRCHCFQLVWPVYASFRWYLLLAFDVTWKWNSMGKLINYRKTHGSNSVTAICDVLLHGEHKDTNCVVTSNLWHTIFAPISITFDQLQSSHFFRRAIEIWRQYEALHLRLLHYRIKLWFNFFK